MGLFGMFGKKKPSLFAPGSGPESEPIRQPQGIFNGGSFTERDGIGLALGAIGDGLAQNSGGQAIVAPMLMSRLKERDEMERAEKTYQRRRADERDDFKWKQDNTPRQPHYWETNDGSLASVGPDGKPQVLYKDPTPKTEWINVKNPDGTMTIMPRPTGGGQGSAGPQPGMVRNGYQFKGGNPKDPSSWVEIPQQQGPQGAPMMGGQGGPDTGYNGQGAPTISQQEAQTLQQSLGPQGFQNWLRQHRVTIRP